MDISPVYKHSNKPSYFVSSFLTRAHRTEIYNIFLSVCLLLTPFSLNSRKYWVWKSQYLWNRFDVSINWSLTCIFLSVGLPHGFSKWIAVWISRSICDPAVLKWPVGVYYFKEKRYVFSLCVINSLVCRNRGWKKTMALNIAQCMFWIACLLDILTPKCQVLHHITAACAEN